MESEGVESTRYLFGCAKHAVLSNVRKTAKILVKTGDLSRNNITKIRGSIRGVLFPSSFASCTTPSSVIVYKNCSDDRFARVFQLLSCRHRYLSSLLDTNIMKNTLSIGRTVENSKKISARSEIFKRHFSFPFSHLITSLLSATF